MGADTTGRSFSIPTAVFQPYPQPRKRNGHGLRLQAVKYGADFGIIFDTDVDRAGAVDKAARNQPQPPHRPHFRRSSLERAGTIVTSSHFDGWRLYAARGALPL
ncbi:MAG: hypothetical protein ACLRSW_13645 [Christensenellaceae bacterium]